MMDYDGRAARPTAEAAAPSSTPSLQPPAIDGEAIWQMSIREGEFMESGPYPERPGEIDCTYYLSTGFCRFGMTCRFNHPPNRQLAIATARMKGGHPERVGQPECQYYLKTGTCKFGATCKFHHPRDKAGIAGRVQLNSLGYPLRPTEKECAYYLRNGACKFGSTCKFHHPQSTNTAVSLRGSVYPILTSPTSSQQSYPGSLTSWPLSRTSFIASPRWQGPSSYTQLILPQGVVQVPSWNAMASETNMGTQGDVSPYRSSTYSLGQLAMQKENVFPERPGQPECEFYMKTGDCKFGAVCKFHHPRERLIPVPNCLLSPIGLPLRPGEPLCIFYSRYGICKFGPNCKFDHPMMTPLGVYTYSLATTSSSDVPFMRRLLGSSSGPPSLTLSSEAPLEAVTGKSRRLTLTESRGDENIESE